MRIRHLFLISSFLFIYGCGGQPYELPHLQDKSLVAKHRVSYAASCRGDDVSDLFDINQIISGDLGIKLWNSGIVYYTIDPNLPANMKKEIKRSMNTWTNKTSGAVEFVEYEASSHSKYTKSVLKIRNIGGSATPIDGTSTTSVGVSFINNKETTMDLRMGSQPVEIMHELGHAIGLIHEHQRPDRNNYLIFKRPKINDWYEKLGKDKSKLNSILYKNYVIFRPKSVIFDPQNDPDLKKNVSVPINIYDPFPYDVKSIMHYSSVQVADLDYFRAHENEYKALGEHVLEEQMKENSLYLDKNCELIPQNKKISNKDIALVKWLYPYRIIVYNRTGHSYRMKTRFDDESEAVYTLKSNVKLIMRTMLKDPIQVDGSYKVILDGKNGGSNKTPISFISLNSISGVNNIEFVYNSNKTIDIYYSGQIVDWSQMVQGINSPEGGLPKYKNEFVEDDIITEDGVISRVAVSASRRGNSIYIVLNKVEREHVVHGDFRRSVMGSSVEEFNDQTLFFEQEDKPGDEASEEDAIVTRMKNDERSKSIEATNVEILKRLDELKKNLVAKNKLAQRRMDAIATYMFRFLIMNTYKDPLLFEYTKRIQDGAYVIDKLLKRAWGVPDDELFRHPEVYLRAYGGTDMVEGLANEEFVKFFADEAISYINEKKEGKDIGSTSMLEISDSLSNKYINAYLLNLKSFISLKDRASIIKTVSLMRRVIDRNPDPAGLGNNLNFHLNLNFIEQLTVSMNLDQITLEGPLGTYIARIEWLAAPRVIVEDVLSE